MKKLFGGKSKSGKGSSRDFAEDGLKPPIATPLYQKLATHGNHILHAPILVAGQPPPPRSAADDERWEVVSTPLPSAATTDSTNAPHLPNPHSPNSQQPIAAVTTPSRTSSLGSLQAQAQGQPPSAPVQPPSQAPLPPAQHHPGVGVLPPRSASPMSTASGTTNKLIKHRPRDQERERDRDAYQTQSQSQSQTGASAKKKKNNQPTAPVALGILRALDPPRADGAIISRSMSEDRDRRTVSESGHGYAPSTYGGGGSVYNRDVSYRDKEQPATPPPLAQLQPPPVVVIEKEKKEKRGFWGHKDKDKDKEKEKEKALEREREKERQREKERAAEILSEELPPINNAHNERGRELRREDDSLAELTRMIGYLTATASEDWALVLDVCDRASANEATAKEAVRALRREFKYGEPASQLSAARLWAIMLHNSSDTFISQSTSRKFLDTLEDLLSSTRTSPVVKERLLEVVAAAAYASGSKKGNGKEGFKGLWKRVKPFDKPDAGVPFDTDDAMFHPLISGRPSLGYEIPTMAYQEPTPPALESAPLTPVAPNPIKERSKRRSPANRDRDHDRIIPPEEDMRRLFQECKIGQGNASLLSQALVSARPEDLKKQEIIREFYIKCRSSQELIYAQIPWATAGAERAMASKEKEREQREKEKEKFAKSHTRKRTLSSDLHNANDRSNSSPDGTEDGTMEERLLAALLGANAELVEVLRQYDDLERVAIERKAEDRSRKETRMDPRQRDQVAAESGDSWGGGGVSTTPSRTPSPPSRSHSPQLSYQSHQQQNHQQQRQYQQQYAPPQHQQQQPLAQPRPKHPGLPESYSYSSDINLLGSVTTTTSNNGSINNNNSNIPNPNLAPPPAAPHGPRSPAQVPSTHSRASSPATPSLGGHGGGHTGGAGYGMVNGHGNGQGYGSQHGHGYTQGQGGYGRYVDDNEDGGDSDEGYGEYEAPVQPSAKALGKRKVIEPDVSAGPQFDPDDMYAPLPDNQFYDSAHGHGQQDPETYSDDDNYSDSHHRPGWPRQPTHFVYDAVAERTKQWQVQLQLREAQDKERERLLQQQRPEVTVNAAH